MSWPDRAPRFIYRLAMDSDGGAMVGAVATDERARLTYTIDEKLLFSLVTGLVSWNAMEASALMPFVTPGPAVSAQTPIVRVTLAHPSAANAAACSCRTSTTSMPSARHPP